MRVALQALSAVLGGTQSLHTNARDEALALPTEESARLALRTQQVIANESGVADVADPLGGSFLVEAWTEAIRDRARGLIAKVDSLGGAVAAIEQGFFQREIEDAAYAAQREIEEKKRLVVGVNVYREESETAPTDSHGRSAHRGRADRAAARVSRLPGRGKERGGTGERAPRRARGPQPHAGPDRGGLQRFDARGDRRRLEGTLRRAPARKLTEARGLSFTLLSRLHVWKKSLPTVSRPRPVCTRRLGIGG